MRSAAQADIQRQVLYSADEPLRVRWESLTGRVYADSRIKPDLTHRDRSRTSLMVDHGRVRRLLDRLRLETDRLRRLADRPTEELLNRLVHLYDKTDDAEIVKALQHDLADLDVFRQQIAEFVLRN